MSTFVTDFIRRCQLYFIEKSAETSDAACLLKISIYENSSYIELLKNEIQQIEQIEQN